MSFLSLASVAVLVLGTPGCTLIGASIGSGFPISPNSSSASAATHNSDPGGPRNGAPQEASVGSYALLGGAFGAIVDLALAGMVISALDAAPFRWGDPNCPSCD